LQGPESGQTGSEGGRAGRSARQEERLCEPRRIRQRVGQRLAGLFRHRSADQAVHRAARTAQEGDRQPQGRQIRLGGGKERGAGGPRGGAKDGKADSIQGKHRAGAKVLRQARAADAGAGFATCRLETVASTTRAVKKAPRERGLVTEEERRSGELHK